MLFSDIIGHDREIEILKKGILQNRVPHALVFSGPNGVGKRLTALSFAKALNCNRFKDDFCNECQNCMAIDNLSFMDVFLVEPREPDYKGGAVDHVNGTIREDAISNVQQRLGYRSREGNKKVCIIDSAERMNRTAQNKLLKTLEEPTPDSVIMLVTCKSLDLIPTVLSRCQKINFRPIGRDIISRFIAERLGISKNEADAIAALSNGSIGTALKIDMEWILEKRHQLIGRLEKLSTDDAEDLLKLAEDISKEEGIKDILDFLKIWYRDMAICSKGKENLVVNLDMLHLIKRHTSSLKFDKIMNCFIAISEAQKGIMPPRYANKQLTMENLFIELAGE